MYYLYILKSTQYNRNYTGVTNNIEKRLRSHNEGRVKSTKRWRPWTVLYAEEYATLSGARKREWFLKCTPQGGKEKRKILEQAGIPAEGPGKAGGEPMKPFEIEKHLSMLDFKWEVEDGKKIIHNFEFKDFVEAMEFVNKVAKIAEDEGHHPDISISYNNVSIRLWTHSMNGLSENDFIVAAKIEKI